MTVFIYFLLPRHMGIRTSSSDDLFLFLEDGCYYAKSLSWLKNVPTYAVHNHILCSLDVPVPVVVSVM